MGNYILLQMYSLKRSRRWVVDVDIIFKIAGIGILTAVVSQILKNSGKDEISTLATLAGIILVIFMVLGMIGDLFESIKSIFKFNLLPFIWLSKRKQLHLKGGVYGTVVQNHKYCIGDLHCLFDCQTHSFWLCNHNFNCRRNYHHIFYAFIFFKCF